MHAAAKCKHGKSLLTDAAGQAQGRESYPDVLNEHAVAEHVVIQVRVKRQPHLPRIDQRSSM